MPRLYYGGDYNPEQWPEAVGEQDAELMAGAGITLATVGVFSWSHLEPAPGRYEFGRLDRVFDRLAERGVGVALATPTASPPPWFGLRHPEALPVRADGVRLSHGSRDTYCVSAPAYREAARRIAAALAGRYGGHPALTMWHVHNEYGTGCHCDLTAEAFRAWLRRRYSGLDELNEVWTTAFWSQRYGDWAEIRPPRATQYLPNPAQVLDFRRFTSDELLAAYTEQRDVLRAATPGVPVTTNFVLGDWVPVDHARWAAEVDLVAIDSYPSEPGPAAEEQAAFDADLARGWARPRTGWLLMETAPNQIHAPGRMHTKEPGRMARHSLAAVARGSLGAMFFQWRAPRGGAEMFHSALVPHAGPDSRVFREATALGGALDRIGEVAAGRVEARIAVAYDAASAWALQAPGLPSDRLDHHGEARRAHRALWRRSLAADVIGPLTGLDAYAMIVLPARYLMSGDEAEALAAWVSAGGRLVVTWLSAIADPAGRIGTGGYPAVLRELLGVRVEEFHPLGPDDRVELSTGATGDLWSETVHAVDAEVTARYRGGVLDGRPAITRRAVGAGQASYVSTRLDEPVWGEWLAAEAAAAGVDPVCPGLPPGVEAVRRRDGGRSWLFVLNHTGTGHDVPAAGADLLTGAEVAGAVHVPAGGAAVVREAHCER